MPDHTRVARHDPPTLADRFDANTWSLAVAITAIAVGIIILYDVVALADWEASHSLSNIPDLVQCGIGILLMIGGLLSSFGILARPEKWKPAVSLILEQTGWMVVAFGWGAFTVAMLENARPGSVVSIAIAIGLTIGAVAKAVNLGNLQRDLRREVEARRVTTDQLEQVTGERLELG